MASFYTPPSTQKLESHCGPEFAKRYRSIHPLSAESGYVYWRHQMKHALDARTDTPDPVLEENRVQRLLLGKMTEDMIRSIPNPDKNSGTRVWMHLEARFGLLTERWIYPLQQLRHERYKDNSKALVADFLVIYEHCKRSYPGTPTPEHESKAFLCAVSFHDHEFSWLGWGPGFPDPRELITAYLVQTNRGDHRRDVEDSILLNWAICKLPGPKIASKYF